MSLGKRLFIGEAAAAAPSGGTSDTLDVFGDGSGVALYTLDYDGSDTSGNYDGTPYDVDFGVDGQINWGASFNGSSSYIQTSLSQNSDNIAISFWMEADATGGTSPILMINNRNGVIVPYAYGTGSNSITANTGNQNILLNSTTLTSQWNHIVINMTGWASSYTASAFGASINMEVFVNGSSIGTTTNKPYGLSTGARLGRSNGSYYFTGKLDQVRMFNKALSSSEVSTLYGETATVYTPTTDTLNYQDTITAYYKFDGNANDETTNYDGTESNITYEFGRFGTAAVFNGTSGYVSLTDIPSSVSADISISAWINADTLSGDRTIISLRENRLIEISINSGYSAGQRLEFKFYDGGNKVINLNENLITVGNWHHICLTAQAGGNMIAYFDGVAQGSPLAIGNVYVAGQGDTIGAYVSGAGGFFDGKIDQVRIYGLLLDATEVANLYNEKQAYITKNASDPFGDNSEEAFYELENNANDSTGSNNGAANNVTFTSGSGLFGTYAASFSGGSSAGSSSIDTNISSLTNNFTISMWLNLQSISINTWFFSNWDSTSQDIYLAVHPNGQLEVAIDGRTGGAGANIFGSSGTFTLNTWHHFVLTMSNGAYSVYLDSTPLSSAGTADTTTNTTFSSGSDFEIGNSPRKSSGYSAWNGQIDQVRILDRALDGDEVFKLYAEVIN